MGKHRFTKVLPFTRVWPHTNNSLLEQAVHGTSGSLGVENHPEFRAGHGFGFLLSMCMRPAFYILTFILISKLKFSSLVFYNNFGLLLKEFIAFI